MKRILYFLFVIVSIVLFACSCEKDISEEELKETEDKVFEEYLSGLDMDVAPTSSGLYFISTTEGEGESPDSGDYVLINYSLYILSNETLIYTTYEQVAEEEGVYDERILYGPNKVPLVSLLPGLNEGLTLMKEGGSATLFFKSELGYQEEGRGPILPYTSLLIKVELLEVIEDPIKNETEKMLQYLNTLDIRVEPVDNQGIYIKEVVASDSWSLNAGEFAILSLTGKLLDGRVFYQNPEFNITVGSSEYDLTEGLNMGLVYMKKGGKYILVVPYNLGYGAEGKTRYEYYVKTPIPPYSTLIYEIEVK